MVFTRSPEGVWWLSMVPWSQSWSSIDLCVGIALQWSHVFRPPRLNATSKASGQGWIFA